MRCGTVTVSDARWDEPHPHVVVTLGYDFVEVPPAVHAWLALWPRILWTGGSAPQCFMPASLRASDVAALEVLEREQRSGQDELLYGARLRRAGVPAVAPPTLPPRLAIWATVWSAMQVTDATPLDELVARAEGWFGVLDDVFLTRPTHMADLIALLRDGDEKRREAAYGFIGRLGLVSDAVLEAMRLRLVAANHGPQEMHRLLIAVAALKHRARGLGPVLREIAQGAKGDYYGEKRLTDVAALVETGQ
jgi:hypothetical protein